MTRRRLALVGGILMAVAAAFVIEEAIRTLFILRDVEQARDRWQRPEVVLRELNLRQGSTVVDVGSGVGYFALKIAPRVARGTVYAVDLRHESLAFLWIRARLAGDGNVHVIVADVDDLRLPGVMVDAALIANTLHEMTTPGPALDALSHAMRADSRLVVVDRAPRQDGGPQEHEISGDVAERLVTSHGFRLLRRDDRFIDRDDQPDVWWLEVFTPSPPSRS